MAFNSPGHYRIRIGSDRIRIRSDPKSVEIFDPIGPDQTIKLDPIRSDNYRIGSDRIDPIRIRSDQIGPIRNKMISDRIDPIRSEFDTHYK